MPQYSGKNKEVGWGQNGRKRGKEATGARLGKALRAIKGLGLLSLGNGAEDQHI